MALVLAACSDGASPQTMMSSTSSAPPTSTTTTTTSSTTTSTVPTLPADEVPTLALYLAAIERGVEGTDLEGAAFEEPEALIETGVLFCGLLDEGLAPVDVLRGWVAALSTEGQTPDEDELLLGGVVLGASVRFICPEHSDRLEL